MLYLPDVNMAHAVEKQALNKSEVNVTTVGSILRSVRLEKDLTLSEMNADCCIAYLSKLERNLIDNPDEGIVRQVCEQLDLSFDKINLTSNGKLIFDLIYALAIKDFDKIEEIHNIIDDSIPYSIKLVIDIVYSYIKDNNADFIDLVTKLYPIKHSVSKIEFAVFILVYVMFYVKTYQLDKARIYLDYLSQLHIDNKYLDCLYYENMFIVEAMSESNNVEFIYRELKKYYDFFYPRSMKDYMRLLYVRNIKLDDAVEVLDFMEKDKFACDVLDYVYTKCYVNIKLGNFEYVYEKLNNNINDFRMLGIYSYAVYMLKKNGKLKNNEIKEIINYIKKLTNNIEIKNEDMIHSYFVNFVLYSIEDSQESFIINYIKEDLLKNAFVFYVYPLYKKLIIEEYIGLIGNSGKYKDAYLFLKYLNEN